MVWALKTLDYHPGDPFLQKVLAHQVELSGGFEDASRELGIVIEAYEHFTGASAEQASRRVVDRSQAIAIQRRLRDCHQPADILLLVEEQAAHFDATNTATSLFLLSDHLEHASEEALTLTRGDPNFQRLLLLASASLDQMSTLSVANTALAVGRLDCPVVQGDNVLDRAVGLVLADPPRYNVLDLLQVLKGLVLAEHSPGDAELEALVGDLCAKLDRDRKHPGSVIVQVLQGMARLGLRPSPELYARCAALVREEGGAFSSGQVPQALAAFVWFKREKDLACPPQVLEVLYERMKATAATSTRDNWDKCRWAFRQLDFDIDVGQNPKTFAGVAGDGAAAAEESAVWYPATTAGLAAPEEFEEEEEGAWEAGEGEDEGEEDEEAGV